MTIYFCGDSRHTEPVRLTSLVQAERDEFPEYIFLISRRAVLDGVLGLRDVPLGQIEAKVTEILTGQTFVEEAQRIVVLPRATARIPFGLYDFATLASLSPTLEQLKDLEQLPHPRGLDSNEVAWVSLAMNNLAVAELGEIGRSTPADCHVVVLPHRAEAEDLGVFNVRKLAEALARSERSEEALRQAIRTRKNDIVSLTVDVRPWQVIVDCPEGTGNPETSHKMLFEGSAGPKPPIAIGRVPSGRELALEKAVEDDLTPQDSIERIGKQLQFVLGGQALLTSLLAGFGWLTGNLSRAIREAPWAFVLTLLLMAAAILVAISGLIEGAAREGNLNDLRDVRRLYGDRISSMAKKAQQATVLYMLALGFAVIPPIGYALADHPQPPAVVFTFDNSTTPATISAKASMDGLKTAETGTLTIMGFPPSGPGTVLLSQEGGPDTDGKASFEAKLVVPPGYATLTAQVASSEEESSDCSLTQVSAGCTSMAIPGYVSPTGSRGVAAPSVTIEPGDGTKLSAVAVESSLSGLLPTESFQLVISAYPNGKDASRVVLLRQSVLGDATGKASVKSKTVVPTGTAWISVQLFRSGTREPSCDPAAQASMDDGCALVRVGTSIAD